MWIKEGASLDDWLKLGRLIRKEGSCLKFNQHPWFQVVPLGPLLPYIGWEQHQNDRSLYWSYHRIESAFSSHAQPIRVSFRKAHAS